MLGRYPGVHTYLRQHLVELLVRHPVQLHSVESHISLFENADLPGNGSGRHLVIAGDHYRTDSRPFCVRHRFYRLGSWRVHHGNQADEGKILLVLHRGSPFAFHLPIGKGEHPQPVLRKLGVDLGDPLPVLLGHGTYPVMGENPVGTGQQYVDGAFGQKGGNPFDVM